MSTAAGSAVLAQSSRPRVREQGRLVAILRPARFLGFGLLRYLVRCSGMAKLILLSNRALWDEQAKCVRADVLLELQKVRLAGHAVFCVSNHAQPPWWSACSKVVQYQKAYGRQSGKIVSELVAANQKVLRQSDVVVLGTSEEDFLMAVNSRSILLACGWSPELHAKTKH